MKLRIPDLIAMAILGKTAAEIWAWMIDYIPHKKIDVLSCPCPNLCLQNESRPSNIHSDTEERSTHSYQACVDESTNHGLGYNRRNVIFIEYGQ